MHLVEQYALSCGVKIDKPAVEVNFFPLPFDKYIIIHPSLVAVSVWVSGQGQL